MTYQENMVIGIIRDAIRLAWRDGDKELAMKLQDKLDEFVGEYTKEVVKCSK